MLLHRGVYSFGKIVAASAVKEVLSVDECDSTLDYRLDWHEVFRK